MKNVNVLLSRTVLIGLMALSIACVDKKKGNDNEGENHHNEEMHEEGMNHDGEMMDEANTMNDKSDMMVKQSKTASSLIDSYLAIKNALVNDDKDAAAKAGERLAHSAATFDVSQVETSQQQEIKEILEVMKEHGKHIAESDIAHQREHFAQIHRDMKDMVAITGSDRTLYQQYCPMYDNNEGGAWLSASKAIKNPLFGSKMMKCGAVKQTIAVK
jgi:hypothetical protein